MKLVDILRVEKRSSNREKAAQIRADLKQKAKESNPRPGNDPIGWNGSPSGGHYNGEI